MSTLIGILMQLQGTNLTLSLDKIDKYPHKACLLKILECIDPRLFQSKDAQNNITALMRHPCPGYILQEFRLLTKSLTHADAQLNFNTIINLNYPDNMVAAHNIIMQSSSETTWESNCYYLLFAFNPPIIANIIQTLHKTTLFHEENAEKKLKTWLNNMLPKIRAEDSHCSEVLLDEMLDAMHLSGRLGNQKKPSIVNNKLIPVINLKNKPRLKAALRKKYMEMIDSIIIDEHSSLRDDAIKTSDEHVCGLLISLSTLRVTGLLHGSRAQANLSALLNSEPTNLTASILNLLHKTGLLSGHNKQDNFDAVINYEFAKGHCSLFEDLFNNQKFHGPHAQTMFNALAITSSTFGNNTYSAWNKIPIRKFTPGCLNKIIQIINQHPNKPLEAGEAFVNYVSASFSSKKHKHSDDHESRFFKKQRITADAELTLTAPSCR